MHKPIQPKDPYGQALDELVWQGLITPEEAHDLEKVPHWAIESS